MVEARPKKERKEHGCAVPCCKRSAERPSNIERKAGFHLQGMVVGETINRRGKLTMNVQEQNPRNAEGAWNRLLAAVKDVSADEQISLGMTLAVASYVGQEGFRRGLSLEQCGKVGMAMSTNP